MQLAPEWARMAMGVWEVYGSQIVEMRQQGYTLQEIGDKIGVCRERVRQLLTEHNVPKPSVYNQAQVARLVGCGGGVLDGLRKKGVVSPVRHGHFWVYSPHDVNRVREVLARYREMYSSVTLTCGQCGEEFQLGRRDYNARLRRRKTSSFFCSRACHGKYIASRYGFGVHPEHTGLGGSKRKWDYSKVYSLWQETKWSQSKLAITLGIPTGTIGSILQKYPDYKPSGYRFQLRDGLQDKDGYNREIGSLWAEYRKKKTKLVARLRKEYEEKAIELYEKYKQKKGGLQQ